jgi:hypothetical protein
MAIALVQTATGDSGATGTTNSITITLGSTPVNGNTLILVSGTSAGSHAVISSIVQTGATWVKAVNKSVTLDCEIWYASNVSSAGTSIVVHYSATGLFGSAAAAEYSGLATSSVLDQTATNNGSSASPSTGTTATTTEASELWVGALASTAASAVTFSSPTNGFTIEAQHTHGSGGYVSIGLLDKIVSTTGTASTGATASASGTYSAAIATFKTPSTSTVTFRRSLSQYGSRAGSRQAIGRN